MIISTIKEVLSVTILAVLAYWFLKWSGLWPMNPGSESFVDGIYFWQKQKPPVKQFDGGAGPANFGSDAQNIDDNYEREFDQSAIEYQGFLPYKNEGIENGGHWKDVGNLTGHTTDPQYRCDYSSPAWESAGLEHRLQLPNGLWLPNGIQDERMGNGIKIHPSI